MERISIWELLSALCDFTPVPRETLDEASISDIDNDTNVEFSVLVEQWKAGMFDEDPELLVQRLTAML